MSFIARGSVSDTRALLIIIQTSLFFVNFCMFHRRGGVSCFSSVVIVFSVNFDLGTAKPMLLKLRKIIKITQVLAAHCISYLS